MESVARENVSPSSLYFHRNPSRARTLLSLPPPLASSFRSLSRRSNSLSLLLAPPATADQVVPSFFHGIYRFRSGKLITKYSRRVEGKTGSATGLRAEATTGGRILRETRTQTPVHGMRTKSLFPPFSFPVSRSPARRRVAASPWRHVRACERFNVDLGRDSFDSWRGPRSCVL